MVREQLARMAREVAATRAHYLSDCFGAIPGQRDCVGRQLEMVNDFEWRSLAVQAAKNRFNNLICCGRYMTPDRKVPAALTRDPPSNALGTWVGALPSPPHGMIVANATGIRDTQLYTQIQSYTGGYWPRRHLTSGDGAEFVYLGENCSGKMHFDCLGFICYLLTRALGRTVQVDFRLERNWRGRCSEITQGQAGPGDFVFTARHIALVVERGGRQLIHANGDSRGVEQTPFNPGAQTWAGRNPRWFRFLDRFLRYAH